MTENENREPDSAAVPENGMPTQPTQPSGGGTPPPPRKKALIIAAIAATGILLVALGLFFAKNQPLAPVETPVQPGNPSGQGWVYPSEETRYSLAVDDFTLALDGTIKVYSDMTDTNGGLTKAFLEANTVFEPPVSFTVLQDSPKAFTLKLVGGETLDQVRITIKASKPQDNFVGMIGAHFSARLISGDGLSVLTMENDPEDPNGWNRQEPQPVNAIDRPIQVEFSKLLDPASIAGAFRLCPASQDGTPGGETIACSVTTEKNVVTLTPEKMLAYQQAYFVVVADQIMEKDGGRLKEKAELPFTTEIPDYRLIMTNRGVNSFHPDSEVKLEYQLATDQRRGKKITTQLYALPDAERYRAYLAGEKEMGETDLTPIGQEKTVDLKEGLNAVLFPRLEKGFYLVKTTAIDSKTQQPVSDYKVFQVVTQTFYMQATGNQMLLWLNDSMTGGSLAGYTVAFTQNGKEIVSAVTGADGSVLLNYQLPKQPEDLPTDPYGIPTLPPILFTIRDPAGAAVYTDTSACMSLQNSYGYRKDGRYYSFLYLDRALYRPTDTIHFWGYVKPYLMNKAAPPTVVTVTLDPDGMNQTQQVNVKADGTYTGEFTFDKIVSSTYELRAEIEVPAYQQNSGEEPITTHPLASSYVEIKEFTKPAYLITASVDKLLYRYEDEIDLTITPTFYDGTPLPNYPVEFSLFDPYSGNFEAIETLTTDAQGVLHKKFHAGEGIKGKELSWSPKRGYYYLKIANDGESVSYQGEYAFLPGNVMVRPNVTVDPTGNAQLTVRANRIVLDKITEKKQVDELIGDYYSQEDEGNKYDILAGEPVDMQLRATIEANYVEPVDYSWQNATEERTVEVKNGTGSIGDLLHYNYVKDSYAYIRVQVNYEANGNKIQSNTGAGNNLPRWQNAQDKDRMLKGYTFTIYKNGGTKPVQERDEYDYRTSVQADDGDRLRFELCLDGVPVKAESGRLLYTVIQDELIGRGYGTNGFTLTENPRYANSILVVAAYYDGRDVHPVGNCYVRMNQESMALTIDTKTDRESYRPGEQVTIRAHVADRNGKPVSARVIVSVVDEAIFALREQSVNALMDLYGEMDFQNYFIYKYTTLTGDINPYNQSGDGGKGEGMPLEAYDTLRKNFKDTAAFYPLRSDANGNAQVSFQLPDNTTSWRITSAAVGDNLYAGNSKTNFVTTLPFFVKPVITPKYIVGDEVTMLAQGFGTALQKGDPISYKIQITGDGVDGKFEKSGKAGEPMQITFGKLAEGEYTIRTTAQFGQMRDTVELPLTVISSNLELVVNREIPLDRPVELAAMRYPVVITLYDKEYDTYYKSISTLLTHYCYRIDQRMARFTAKRALMKYSDPATIPQYIRVDDEDLSGYQAPDGGISWISGGESDPMVSFKAFLIARDSFNPERLKRYFVGITDNSLKSPVERATAHAGIAAIDPNYTARIHELLEKKNDASMEEKAYLLAGLAYGGDNAGARALYSELIEPKLRSHGEEKWVEFSSAPTETARNWENEQMTALAWLTASKLALPDADAFANHFGRNQWQINNLFECMAYISNFQKPISAPATFSYLSGGKTQEVDLGVTGRKSITFNYSDMQGLEFKNVPASVKAIAYYIGEPDEVGIQPSDSIHIKKTFTPMDGGKYKVSIQMAFELEASYGYYNISDWIPSNMRLHTVAKQPNDSTMWIGHTQENQKMYFEFYRDEHTPEQITIEYYTQRTFDKPAVVDRTYLICADSGENASTERSTIG